MNRETIRDWLDAEVGTIHKPKPQVQVSTSRSGATVTVTLTIQDHYHQFVLAEFNKREGAAAATGWVSTWDTSTGTLGNSYQFTRVEDVSVPAGLDSSFDWRVTYRDVQGESQTFGGSVPMGNLQSFTATKRVTAMRFVPSIDTYTWLYNGRYLSNNGTLTTQTFRGELELPIGVVVETIRARMYEGGAGDSVIVSFHKWPDGGASSQIGNQLSPTVAGSEQEAEDAGVSETIAADTSYYFEASIDPNAASDDARLYWAEVDITVPDHARV